MTRKKIELYEAVMQMMHNLASDFQTTQVIADFEEAPTAAVRDVFGNDVTVFGCWFHYAQSGPCHFSAERRNGVYNCPQDEIKFALLRF